jgi:hypothetical protein
VEVHDHGMMVARRIGGDKLDLTYLEGASHAVAYSAIYRAQKEIAAR